VIAPGYDSNYNGVVWAPTAKFSIGADYHHWDIKNEVNLQNVNQLLLDEYNCNAGNLDLNSGTCQAAYTAITRNGLGIIQQIDITKINVSDESLNAVTAEMHYLQSLGSFGDLKLDGSWTRNLDHDYQQYPTDPQIDLLNNPFWSTDPHYRANASVAWSKDRWTATLYANYIGPTPNYRSGLVAPGCLALAQAQFEYAWTRLALNNGCSTGDEIALTAKMDAFVADMVVTLDP
jgi:hypothetical protein